MDVKKKKGPCSQVLQGTASETKQAVRSCFIFFQSEKTVLSEKEVSPFELYSITSFSDLSGKSVNKQARTVWNGGPVIWQAKGPMSAYLLVLK